MPSTRVKHTRQELTNLRDQLQGEEAWVGLAEELVEAGLTEEEAVEAGVSKRVTDSMASSARALSIRNQSLRGGDVSSRSTSLRRAAGGVSARGAGKQKWLGLGTRLDDLALGEEAEDQLSEMANDALKAARLIKMLALEIDYEDVELDLSEEPSAALPNQGSVARPEYRGPGMLLLGAELASLELDDSVTGSSEVAAAIAAADESLGLDEDEGEAPSRAKPRGGSVAQGGRGRVMLAGDGMKASMSEAEEIALAESDETRELARARQGSMTSLARPNVHIRDFELPSDGYGIELSDSEPDDAGGAEPSPGRQKASRAQRGARLPPANMTSDLGGDLDLGCARRVRRTGRRS